MPKARVLIAAVLAIIAADGADFRERLSAGYEIVERGDWDEAVAHFEALKSEGDNPDMSDYALAYTEYARGLNDLKEGAADTGTEHMRRALQAFRGLQTSADAFVSRHAALNAATAQAQLAKQIGAQESFEAKTQALKDAIRSYEQVLADHPEMDAAATNRNHLRYALKTLLQQPPEPQQDPSEGDENQGNEDQQDESESGESDQNEPEQEETENSNEENPEQQEPTEDENEADSPGQPEQQPAETEPRDNQNIEAILQSLEDQDRKEQEKLRRSKVPPQIRGGKWW